MEPTTVLMFIILGASIGLFGMAISRMFKTFRGKIRDGTVLNLLLSAGIELENTNISS